MTDYIYVQDNENPARIIAGEAVVLTLTDSTIHILNGVGTEIWQRCGPLGCTERNIVEHICEEYNVDEEQACLDVREFLREMVQKRLLLQKEPS